MKIVNDHLYVEWDELLRTGITTHSYLTTARNAGKRSLRFIDDPDDLRRALIHYESMAPRYKNAVIEKYGNPYEYIAKAPVLALIERDLEAERYFLAFRFENGSQLPTEYVNKYTIAASWLQMLKRVEADKKAFKKALNISLTKLWDRVVELIVTEKVQLPTTYVTLRRKFKTFLVEGYPCLISGRFNNDNSLKVKGDTAQAVLMEMIAHDSKRDDVVVASAYNGWAAETGQKTITSAAVGMWRRNNEYMLQPYRSGQREWYNKYGKQILRMRPSAPMLLWSGDGNDLDLYFRVEKSEFGLFTLVVVIDAYNDYILGWSMGQNENADLIRAAYVDALQHVKELTGSYYLPLQLQSDRFANKQLTPFFQLMDDKYFPAAARSPRGKYIERTFGTTWHQQLSAFPNYSGTNIASRTRINPERIERNKRNFPAATEAFEQAHTFVSSLRSLPGARNKEVSKAQEWLEAFQTSELSKSKPISEEQFLFHFGTRNTNTQTVTNRGLAIQFRNQQLLFEIPDELFLQVVGKKVQAIHDPYDLEGRCLITDGEKIRFTAFPPVRIPAARADQTAEDQARFWKRLHAKKAHMEAISDSKQKRERVLTEEAINPVAYLQAGILDKGIKRAAEVNYHQQYLTNHTEPEQPFDPLDLM